MYLELIDLFWLLLIGSVLLFWYRGLAVRERALVSVRKHCDQMDLQLLDQTVALRSLWLQRDERGRIQLRRRYNFEFTSTGDERYQGQVVFLGSRLESIETQAHRMG
ncbi:MAG TPA: DUF3301 domain-containing protein [Marinobacterium sp.]|nr:DUF3301 domain-containing protein [Marinobacterium sp.]